MTSYLNDRNIDRHIQLKVIVTIIIKKKLSIVLLWKIYLSEQIERKIEKFYFSFE